MEELSADAEQQEMDLHYAYGAVLRVCHHDHDSSFTILCMAASLTLPRFRPE